MVPQHKEKHHVTTWSYAIYMTSIVHPNVNTASILLSTADLLRFLAARCNRVTYIVVAARDTEN